MSGKKHISSGGFEMAESSSPTERRHVRDKATIDHLVKDTFVPKPPGAEPTIHGPTTDTGLPIEDQVRKEWDTNTDGGLPIP
jgi:hypothetical protein